MVDDNTEQSSRGNPNIENVDFEVAQRGMQALDEIEPILNSDDSTNLRIHSHMKHHHSLKRRGKHLQAAFIGSVTIPLMAVILISAGSGVGWLTAAIYYNHLEAKKIESMRFEAEANAWHRLGMDLSKVREDADENEYYIDAWTEFQLRIEELGRTQPQDQ